MPLPKIRDGEKLTLTFPADVVRRLKIEAMEESTIPSLIVLEALDKYWGGNSEASDPTVVAKDQEQRKACTRLLHYVDTLVAEGKLRPAEIARAAGVQDSNPLPSWSAIGYVPVRCVGGIVHLLRLKNLPLPGEAAARAKQAKKP